MIEIKRKSKDAAEMPAGRAQMPIDGLEVPAGKEQAGTAETPLQGEKTAFTGIDNARDYRAIYRAVFGFHKQYSTPHIDRNYWKDHTPGADDTPQTEIDYWVSVWDEMKKVTDSFKDNRFVIDMMAAVMAELNREYNAARQAASQHGASI